MQITFNIPEFTCFYNERNSHCDVLHITPIRVANLVLDDAIATSGSLRSRRRDKGLLLILQVDSASSRDQTLLVLF